MDAIKKDSSLCGHVFSREPRVRCGKEKDHEGIHGLYDCVSSNEEETKYVVYEWNDNGEVRTEDEGVAFPCDYSLGWKERNKIMSLVIMDARATLSEGDFFEVRSKIYPKKNGVQDRKAEKDWGICWMLCVDQPEGFESMKKDLVFINDVDNGVLFRLGGYNLLARIRI